MTVKKNEKPEPTETVKNEQLFSREQLLAAERFAGRRDILSALLRPDEQYTLTSAENLIENYMKGRVN